MKQFLYLTAILLGIGFCCSCSKIGTKNDLLGTWKRDSSIEAFFNGEKVGTASIYNLPYWALSQNDYEALFFETLEFHENTLEIMEDGESYSLTYNFENGNILISVFTHTDKWSVTSLTNTELVIDAPVDGFNASNYNLLDDPDSQYSLEYKGKRIYLAIPKNISKYESLYDYVRFFYVDSNGKRVPCVLVNKSFKDALVIDGGQIRLADNLVFATSSRIRYTKIR